MVVAFGETFVVGRDDIGEVVAVYQFFQLFELLMNGSVRGNARCLRDRLRAGNKFLHNARQCATLGLAAGGHVADQLRVERLGLAAAGVQATVGIQIGIGHYQFLFQSDSTQEIQEEGFTGTVFAHHHPERRAAFG